MQRPAPGGPGGGRAAAASGGDHRRAGEPGCIRRNTGRIGACLGDQPADHAFLGQILNGLTGAAVHVKGIEDHQDAIRREAGYRRAHEEAGIRVDPELICKGEFDGDSGVAAIDSLLDRGIQFTAVFASNDMMGFGARLALYRRGISVPEQVSIVGFDDQAECAFVTPPLTTVKQPANPMGVAAANAMLKMISEEEYRLPKLVPELIVRESTQALGQA